MADNHYDVIIIGSGAFRFLQTTASRRNLPPGRHDVEVLT